MGRLRSRGPKPRDRAAAPDDRKDRADEQPRLDQRRAGFGQRSRCATVACEIAAPDAARSSPSTARRSRPSAWRSSCSASKGAGEGGRKVGLFEQAHGGTLFLDEAPDMPLETQGKILRVLVEQNFQRVGGGPKVQVDVRVMSSCSADPRVEIQDGRLREDLYHRLNVVGIRVPPLIERREDIPQLVDHFMQRISAATGLQPRKVGDDAMAALQAHNWPGNIRQLRNNVERLLILAADDPEGVISADLLPADVGSSTPAVSQGAGSERIIALPLARCARDVREGISAGADQSLRRQHLAHGGLHRHGAVGAASQAEVAGHQHRRPRRRFDRLMSRIVYVNGRYVPYARASVHIDDRGFQFADGVYEVCAVRGGRVDRRGAAFEAAGAIARRVAHRLADRLAAASARDARDGAAQSRRRRFGLCADQRAAWRGGIIRFRPAP